jgi:hypothetical protein
MTITDRGTPDTVTGLTLEERVERMEAMWGEIATHLGLTSPAGHADMGDPLAPFRLPDGSVAYLSIPVGGLRAGDWFQRQRGDDGWHQVRPLIFGGDQVGVPFDETGLEWFGRDQMVRVARTPEHVVAAQERRWETGR